jgi:RND family efflux transporter MFP subunit
MKPAALPLAALTLALGLGCGSVVRAQAVEAPPAVLVARATAAPATSELTLPGTVEAWQETPVHARIGGYVARWHAEIGDHVEAGAMLVELDAPELDQALAAARAARAQAAANLDIARTTYERWRALGARKTVPLQEVDERRAVWAARRADRLAADAEVGRLEEQSAFKQVRAPFAGTVTRRNVELGALVDAGGSTARELYRVAETRRLRIRVPVPQARLRAIAPGQPASVLVAEYPGQTFAGHVARTAGALDPATRTLLTEVELANDDGRLLPGLYAQVRIELAADAETVLVPTNAVRIDAAGAHVAVVEDSGKVRLQPVDLGRNLGTQVEVLHRLAPGAAVILNPTDLLRDGLEVRAKEVQPPKV